METSYYEYVHVVLYGLWVTVVRLLLDVENVALICTVGMLNGGERIDDLSRHLIAMAMKERSIKLSERLTSGVWMDVVHDGARATGAAVWG